MTNQEQILLYYDDYFKKLKLDFMVVASTLLGIVREGKIIKHDYEVDVCVHGTDVTNDLLDRFKKDGVFGTKHACREEFGEIYLSTVEKPNSEQGWLAITPLWHKKGVCYFNMVNDDCIVWDPKYYPKKTWSTIKYLGRKFKAPSDPKAWLEMWYGSDWETPLSCNWTSNKNRKLWKDLWL